MATGLNRQINPDFIDIDSKGSHRSVDDRSVSHRDRWTSAISATLSHVWHSALLRPLSGEELR
jgi:hypothetical protein